jgi:hypothetical protein
VKHVEIWAALAAPFSIDEVRTRSQSGREFQYVTARTVMNRLDEVLGPAGWWDEYTPMENAVVCRLTVELPDGTTLTKSDAGGFTNTADTSDYEKSGFSDAFKRAAVKFGIARYLYGDGIPLTIRQELAAQGGGRRAAEDVAPRPKGNSSAQGPGRPTPARPARQDAPRRSAEDAVVPRSGKAFFAWVKERDEKLCPDLLRHVSEWGKGRDYPARMIQWNDEQIEAAHAEALRLINGQAAGPPRLVAAG